MLISVKIDWFDLFAVQGTFRSLHQQHSLKTSILQYSAFFPVQLSQLYLTTGKTRSSELNYPIPVYFSLLIPKMSMCFLTISCLTISNFPWFMDLTSQVPQQDSTLHYQNLLPPPDSHNWTLFLLRLCLFILSGVISCSSSVVYWTPTNLGRFIFWFYISLPFHTVNGVLKTQILKWFAIHLLFW